MTKGGRMMIEFKNVTKVFGKTTTAVDNLSLTIEKGEFVVLIGTSGSGKTTTMRMINRMEEMTKGDILINGKSIKSFNEVNLRRQIGYVIQQIGLMPHMNIYENIVMVPRLLKWDEEKMQAKAEELMERVDLDLDLLTSYPSELSGGMQQRIGVIRALAADQEILLMDEPFGALDPITRDSLQRLIKRLQSEMNTTIVFVTHDMDEALSLADRVVILSEGKVIQQGSPKEILTNPANDFVKELVGEDRLNQASFEYDTIEKIMLKEPVKINQNQPLGQLLSLMNEHRVDDILVVDDDNKLMGRVDWYTLSKRIDPNTIVKDIMKRVTYVLNTTTIRDAIYYIHDLGYRNLSVVDETGTLVGLVTRGSIVSEMYDVFWSAYNPLEEEIEMEMNVEIETAETVQSAAQLIEENGVDQS